MVYGVNYTLKGTGFFLFGSRNFSGIFFEFFCVKIFVYAKNGCGKILDPDFFAVWKNRTGKIP